MTKEKLAEINQQKENIDYLSAVIDRIEMFGITLDTPSKTITYKEAGNPKVVFTIFENEINIQDDIMKIMERTHKAQLKSLRQYRAKLQGKFNRL